MRWFWEHVAVPLWPNLAASAIWATPALFIHHRLLKRHITKVGNRD